jgi:hypothetical protein
MKKFAIVAFVMGMAGIAYAADPTGTWTWKTKFGDKEVERTMKLELKDGKLTGTVSGFGGKGGKGGKGGGDSKIEDAKYDKDKDEFSFSVTREFGGNKVVTKYTGKVSGDTIKGTITRDRDGKEEKTEFEAKKTKDEKKKD